MSFSQVPASPGPIRSSQSPRARYGPYSRGHSSFSSRSPSFTLTQGFEPLDENTIPPSNGFSRVTDTPSHLTEAEYPAYNAPTPTISALGRTAYGSRASNHVPSNRITGHTTTVHAAPHDVDKLVNEYKLNKERQNVHKYSESIMEQKMMILYCESLKAQQLTKELKTEVSELKVAVCRIDTATQQGWVATKEQEVLLRGLVRHFLIKPQNTYTVVPDLCADYILKHARTLRLGIYANDATVREKVDEIVLAQFHNMKSNLRKAVFTSVKNGQTLSQFATRIVKEYHLPKVPSVIPQDVLAAFALLRKVGAPLSKKSNVRGGDTGFWKTVEKELDDLWKEHGTDRSTEGWKTWESEIIEADNAMYAGRLLQTAPATREEICAAAESAHASTSQERTIRGTNTAAADEVEIPPTFTEDTMNGSIEINQMDLASLT